MQPVRDRPLARKVDNLLRPLHSHGALTRNQTRQLHRPLHRLVLVVIHTTHKPMLQRLVAPKDARRQRNLLDPGMVPDTMRQPTQRPNVGSQADVDFLDAELRGGG